MADGVPAEVKTVVDETVKKIVSGEIEVKLDTSKIG